MAEILRIGRLVVYAAKIARGDNGSTPPWRGYCWGSDFPRASFHRGDVCYCLDLSWLMFYASIYWNRRPKEQEGGR